MQLSLQTLSAVLGLAVAALGAPAEATEASADVAAARDCNPNFYMCNYQSLPHSWVSPPPPPPSPFPVLPSFSNT